MRSKDLVPLSGTVVVVAIWLCTGVGLLSAQTEADRKAYEAGRSGGGISSTASESEHRAYNNGQLDAEADAQSQAEAAKRGAESQAAIDATRAKLAKTRAIVVKQPPLPDARNPLLGRWVQISPAPGVQGLTQLLTNPDGAICSALFGEDQFEYRPMELVLEDAGADVVADKVQYRAAKDGAVFVLGDRLFSILLFEFEGRDRAKTMGCTYARVTGGPARAASRTNAAAQPAPGRPAGAPPSPTTLVPVEAARTYPGAGFVVAGVRLGIDGPSTVNKQIAARGGSSAVGGGLGEALGPLRLYGRDADYTDLGQNIYSVAYDFDRADPAGQLIAVTFIYASAEPLGPILQSRASELAAKYGLPAPTSPVRYEATVENVSLVLRQDPAASAVLETWSVVR